MEGSALDTNNLFTDSGLPPLTVVEQDMGRTRLVARNEMGLRSETGETGRETLKKASSPNLGNKDLGREVSVR